MVQNLNNDFSVAEMTGDFDTCLSQLAINTLLSTKTSILVLHMLPARFFRVYRRTKVSLAVMGKSRSWVSQ